MKSPGKVSWMVPYAAVNLDHPVAESYTPYTDIDVLMGCTSFAEPDLSQGRCCRRHIIFLPSSYHISRLPSISPTGAFYDVCQLITPDSV